MALEPRGLELHRTLLVAIAQTVHHRPVEPLQPGAGALTDFIPHYARPDKLPHLLQVTPELKSHPLAKEPRLLELAQGI